MNLTTLDIAIFLTYLVLTISLGFWISKKARKNLDSYFLGGKTLPWYMLGLSNASGMFDIAGTMWMVAILFVYGVKSTLLPWLCMRASRSDWAGLFESPYIWNTFTMHWVTTDDSRRPLLFDETASFDNAASGRRALRVGVVFVHPGYPPPASSHVPTFTSPRPCTQVRRVHF